jgi:DNA-binding response OmpR family regulator
MSHNNTGLESQEMDVIETPAPLSLLLIEDDKKLCAMMAEFFAEAGHRLHCEHDGHRGLISAVSGTYDLLILDVMLPVYDGFFVLQKLRSRSDVPVIMLTACVEHNQRIQGLNYGADDYLLKPFDPDELLARVQAVLRRANLTKRKNSTEMTIGDIRIDTSSRTAWRSNMQIDLTQMEFQILEMLMRSAGRTITRDEMTLVIFESQTEPYSRMLDVHISNLRRKLEVGRTLIRTIRGVGYVFAGTA